MKALSIRQHGLDPDEVLPGIPCDACEAREQ